MPTLNFSGPIKEVKQPDYLKKKDLFVKDRTIYLLDTFEHKTGNKIAAFRQRVGEAIEAAKKHANACKEIIRFNFPNPNPRATIPQITIYVNCPDDKIDERAKTILDMLSNAVMNGTEMTVHNIGNENSVWANTLNEINTNAEQTKSMYANMQNVR